MPFKTTKLSRFQIRILSSYPTSTYFHSWHEDSYRLSPKSFLRRNDDGYGDQVLPLFGHVNTSQRKGEVSYPTGGQAFAGHSPAYHQEQGWYPFHERPRTPTYPQPANVYPQPEFGRADQVLTRRVSDTFPPAFGDQFTGNAEPHGNSYGVQNIENTYSSHVDCQVQNQNERVTKSPKVPPPPPKTSLRNNDDERINFEDSSRNMRNGSSREVEMPDARIVTPKSGARRPTQAMLIFTREW